MYKCECGKEFDNPQSFNGHKSHCKIHAISCNKLDTLIDNQNKRRVKQKNT